MSARVQLSLLSPRYLLWNKLYISPLDSFCLWIQQYLKSILATFVWHNLANYVQKPYRFKFDNNNKNFYILIDSSSLHSVGKISLQQIKETFLLTYCRNGKKLRVCFSVQCTVYAWWLSYLFNCKLSKSKLSKME